MSDINKQFDQAMLSIYNRAKAEVNYTASAFFSMLHDRRGVATAKYLINSDKPSDGYTRLYELGRLDLTVEATVVDDARWHALFTSEELGKARKRLLDYGYKS